MRDSKGNRNRVALSRREILVGSGVVAAVAVGGFSVRVAEAQSESPRDVGMLNGLLVSEYNAIEAYEAGIGILLSPASSDPLASIAPTAVAVAEHFSGQHRDHAAQLATMIRNAGGTPVTYDDANFTVPPGFTPSVLNVLRLASNAEKHAAVLYIRSLGSVTSRLAAQLLASIGGDETQHFIVLSLLAQGIVAPTANTLALANDVVPQSFVVQTASVTTGLEHVPDFELE